MRRLFCYLVSVVMLTMFIYLPVKAGSIKDVVNIEKSIAVKTISDEDFSVWISSQEVLVGSDWNKYTIDLPNIVISSASDTLYQSYCNNYGDFLINVTNEGYDLFEGNDYDFKITTITLKTDKYMTARGIYVGNTEQLVRERYGRAVSGSSGDCSLLIYSYNGKSIFFFINKDDLVEKIVISLDSDVSANGEVTTKFQEGNPEILIEEQLVYDEDGNEIIEEVIAPESSYVFEMFGIASEEAIQRSKDITTEVTASTICGNEYLGTFRIPVRLLVKHSLRFKTEGVSTSKFLEYSNVVSCYEKNESFLSLTLTMLDSDSVSIEDRIKPLEMEEIAEEEVDEICSTDTGNFEIVSTMLDNKNFEAGVIEYISNDEESYSSSSMYIRIDDKRVLEVGITSADSSLVSDEKIYNYILRSYSSPSVLDIDLNNQQSIEDGGVKG